VFKLFSAVFLLALLALLPMNVEAAPPNLGGHSLSTILAEKPCPDGGLARLEVWVHGDANVPDYYVVTRNNHLVAAKPFGRIEASGWYLYGSGKEVTHEELAATDPCALPVRTNSKPFSKGSNAQAAR